MSKSFYLHWSVAKLNIGLQKIFNLCYSKNILIAVALYSN